LAAETTHNDPVNADTPVFADVAVPGGPCGDGAPVAHPTRRGLVSKGAKLLAYSAPAVTLFRPTQALAASGMSPTS